MDQPSTQQHDVRIHGAGAELRLTIDGEDIPVAYEDGHYRALRHHPYRTHATPEELADSVVRDVLDMRRD